MNATTITLHSESSKLRKALIDNPHRKNCRIQTELAEFLCIEVEALTFSDGAIYLHGCELTLDDSIPAWWCFS